MAVGSGQAARLSPMYTQHKHSKQSPASSNQEDVHTIQITKDKLRVTARCPCAPRVRVHERHPLGRHGLRRAGEERPRRLLRERESRRGRRELRRPHEVRVAPQLVRVRAGVRRGRVRAVRAGQPRRRPELGRCGVCPGGRRARTRVRRGRLWGIVSNGTRQGEGRGGAG